MKVVFCRSRTSRPWSLEEAARLRTPTAFSVWRSLTLVPYRPKGYHELPLEVLVQVFSYFPESDVCCSLAPVCKHWSRAAKHPALCRRLEFSGDSVPTATICRMLRSAPRLQHLRLVSIPNVATVIRQMCRCNMGIAHLAVRYCTKRKEEVVPDTVLMNLITSCPYLVSLDLQGTQYQAHRLFKDLALLPRLHSLSLGANRFLRTQDLLMVALNCHGLQELKVNRRRSRLGQAPLTDHDAIFVFGHLERLLLVLKFDMGGLGEASYQAILKCSKLRQLTLNNAQQFPGDLFRSLPDHLPHLTKLKLRQTCKLKCMDFCQLFHNYGDAMRRLELLDMTGCWGLSDAGLRCIADTCGDTLQHLSVRCCHALSSEALEYAISHCKRLRHLNVAHATKLNAASLNQIPGNMPELQILVVDNDTKKRNALCGLKTKMKHLKIIQSLSEYSRKEKIFQT